MTEEKRREKPIQQVADETRDLIMRHVGANTAEDDARREAERDARVKAALAELAHQGKLPPRKSKADVASQKSALPRLGPAPAPVVCAFLIVALAAFGALVPIGWPSRTLDLEQVAAMVLGAVLLAAWAVALGASAWRLSRAESDALRLSHPFSSHGGYDIAFSTPFIAVVPVTSLALPALWWEGIIGLPALVAAVLWAGLMALRETDNTAYVRDGRVFVRSGWLWIRRDSLPIAQVRGVRVDRDSYRGAPSFVVKLDFTDPEPPARLLSLEARYRSVELANAEAERWRRALGR